jgi:predicted RNA binding protein YcfA (HicA-like mRNA interferase family)
MNFEITLFRAADHTFVVEVPHLPGVITSALDARTALRSVLPLALRVVAERIEFGELAADAGELQFNFSLNEAGRLLTVESDVAAQIQIAVSPEVLQQVAEEVFDRVQNVVGGVEGAIGGALGRPQPLTRRAATVLRTLEAAQWRQHRQSPSHRTLRRNEGEELVFPFRDDDVLRHEVLHRFGTLGGVTF